MSRIDDKHCCSCTRFMEINYTVRLVIIAFVVCFIVFLVWTCCHGGPAPANGM